MIPQVFQRAFRGLLISIGFLTIAPPGVKERATRENIADAIPFFPFAGLFIGFLLYLFYLILKEIFPPFLADALIILFWVIITGALHLDGVADTIDGLYGGRTREEVLRIMRDSHSGAIGATGVIICLILKFAGLYSLPQDIKPGSLLLVPAIARGFLLIPLYFLPYAREKGTGRAFVDGIKTWHLIPGFIPSVLFALLFGSKGLLLLGANLSLLILFLLYIRKRIGGITGDCLGFLCEASEVISLVILSSRGVS